MNKKEIGKTVYQKVFDCRNGFEISNMDIDVDIWEEIFEDLGETVLELCMNGKFKVDAALDNTFVNETHQIPASMDLETKKGDYVVFTAQGGYDADKENATKDLKIGHEYLVKDISIGGWSSLVQLEFNGKWYNTVMFADVVNHIKS